MKENKINIYPRRPLYLFGILLLTIIALGSVITPFALLISNKSIAIGFGIILKGVILFVITLSFSIILVPLASKKILYKIMFNNEILIAPKVSQIQYKKLEIDCSKITTCNIGFKVMYFYFIFECEDGKTREMFIAHFSNKQLKKIIELIKDKGGLADQNTDDILYPIYNKKRRNKILK